MSSPSDLFQQQKRLMDLIFHNQLEEMMQLVPTLPTLNFIAPDSLDSPLVLAVSTAEEEVVEYLLLRQANPNFPSKQTLPLLAAIERSVETDKYWADANNPDGEEDPLFLVQLLLNYGGDFNLKDPRGQSAYEFAIEESHPSWRLFEQLDKETEAD